MRKGLVLGFAAGLALLAMAGCAGTVETRSTNALAIACDNAATVLDQLTPMKVAGKLSAATIARVDNGKKVIDPVCKGGYAGNILSAVGDVEQAIALFTSAKGG